MACCNRLDCLKKVSVGLCFLSILVGLGIMSVSASIIGSGGIPKAGQVSYFHRDLTRNVRMVTDDRGDIVSLNDYTPFGDIIKGHPQEDNFRPKVSGKEIDNATGLVYFGARYYTPVIGQWTQPDPAGLFHYTYLSDFNDPVSSFDPDGQIPFSRSTGAAFSFLDLLFGEQSLLLIDTSVTLDDLKALYNAFNIGALNVPTTRALIQALPLKFKLFDGEENEYFDKFAAVKGKRERASRMLRLLQPSSKKKSDLLEEKLESEASEKPIRMPSISLDGITAAFQYQELLAPFELHPDLQYTFGLPREGECLYDPADNWFLDVYRGGKQFRLYLGRALFKVEQHYSTETGSIKLTGLRLEPVSFSDPHSDRNWFQWNPNLEKPTFDRDTATLRFDWTLKSGIRKVKIDIFRKPPIFEE